MTTLQPVKFFQNRINIFFGYFDPINNFFITKNNDFQGDLSSISAKTATLATMLLSLVRIEYLGHSTNTHVNSCTNPLQCSIYTHVHYRKAMAQRRCMQHTLPFTRLVQ